MRRWVPALAVAILFKKQRNFLSFSSNVLKYFRLLSTKPLDFRFAKNDHFPVVYFLCSNNVLEFQF